MDLPEEWKLSTAGSRVQIGTLIEQLNEIRAKFGNTAVYITGLTWGAVALNEQADDEKAALERDLFSMTLLG